MNEQWVVKSLTIWGVVVALLTALLPALALIFPHVADKITPEWIAGLDANVKGVINSVGVLVGSVMIIIDRLSGETSKTLVLRKPD